MKTKIQTVQGREYECETEEDAGPEALRFWDIFERKSLGIALGEDFWAINPRHIEKVTFHPVGTVRWQSPENLLLLREVSEVTYRFQLKAIAEKEAPVGEIRPDDLVRGVVELTLVSGMTNYLEFMVMLRPEYEQALRLWEIFQKPPFPIPIEGGGFSLFNSANICMARVRPAITGSRFVDYRMCEPDPEHHSSNQSTV